MDFSGSQSGLRQTSSVSGNLVLLEGKEMNMVVSHGPFYTGIGLAAGCSL